MQESRLSSRDSGSVLAYRLLPIAYCLLLTAYCLLLSHPRTYVFWLHPRTAD